VLTIDSIGPMTAGASATTTIGDAPLTTTFHGSASGGNAPYIYAWDLGDGTNSTAASPGHVYSGAGSYTASLTVSDASGQVSRASVQVTVYPALSISTSVSPTSGVAPLQVSVTAAAGGGLAPYTYAWTFGDGTGASGASSAHSYASGTFHPTLAVRDAAGGTWSGSVGAVVVSSPPVTQPEPTPSVPQPSPPAPASSSPTPPASTPPAAGSPSPTSEAPASPAVTTPGAQNPSGSVPAIVRMLLMVLGTLFATGLGGTLFLRWLRHRGL
jgi:PKD repeat protein